MSPATAVMAIGDSHCRFFSGLEPTIVTYHLGAVLAWSFGRNSASKSEAKARTRLAIAALHPDTWALLCFGEIDMRCHVLAPHHMGPSACAARYLDGILSIRHLHPKLAIWAPTATLPSSIPDDQEYPSAGTEQARNAATREFTAYLARLAIGIPVISILDLMVDERGLTKPDMLQDGRHASRALLPEALRRLHVALAPSPRSRLP